MKPNTEQQEAWFADQCARLARDLDIVIEIAPRSDNGLSISVNAPDTISDIVESRLMALSEEMNHGRS